MASAAHFAGRICAAALAGAAMSLAVYAVAGRAGAVGIGTSVVSAATISHVHYRLDGGEPSRIDAVAFSIAPALGRGGVAVRAGDATYRCRLLHAGTRALCPTTRPQLGARDLTVLTVVAAQ